MKEADKIIMHDIPNDKRFVDHSGKTLGRFLVLGYAGKKLEAQIWWCKCRCGTIKKIYGSHLVRGLSKSCGCLVRENKNPRKIIHGMYGTPIYNIYRGMVSRCCNEKNIGWSNYGARGITVCDRWRFGDGEKSGFECFHKDMGDRPSKYYSLDRSNNDGNYCPDNCRWATKIEQHNNTRSNVKLTFKGESLTVAQWSIRCGIPSSTILYRMKKYPKEVELILYKGGRINAKNTDNPHNATRGIRV